MDNNKDIVENNVKGFTFINKFYDTIGEISVLHLIIVILLILLFHNP